MQQRKDEILAKKAKLAEIKRQRELRQQESAQRRLSGDFVNPGTSAPVRSENKEELDNLINKLVGNSKSETTRAKDSEAATSSNGDIQEPTTKAHQQQEYNAAIALPTFSTAPFQTVYDYAPSLPQETLTYSKAVQTSIPWSPSSRRTSDSISDSDREQSPSKTRTPGRNKRLNRREREREEELRERLKKDIDEELKAVQETLPDYADDASRQAAGGQLKFPARTLTEDQLNAVLSSYDYLDFVDKSSKVIERALDEDYDVLADYALDGIGRNDDADDIYGGTRGKKGRRIREVVQFWDERWSKKRMISDIQFSPKFPELVLASYTKNPSAPHDPDGLVQVWNTHLHDRPEYIFHASSDLLTAKFSPFHPNLILGGTYSGQVLLWDTRSKSPSPVQKTPLTGYSGHTHPVYSLNIVGTQNAHNLISCDTDGLFCSWSIDMLSQPQELITLTTLHQSMKTEDLAPTCLAFPHTDPTFFLVGAEDGHLYPCHRYERASAKAGIDQRFAYRGHHAPIRSLSFHPARGPIDFGDLVLSSSLDWSVKLWRSRAPAATSSAAGGATGANLAPKRLVLPLLDFPREDVVYDAKWSPVRPGVFATVDGGGGVEIWDIGTDTEVPAASAVPSRNKGGTGGVLGPRSLNKVAWEEHEGKRLAVGGLDGVVTVFEVGGELGGLEGARAEEWASVKKVIARAEATPSEVEIPKAPFVYGIPEETFV